MAPSDLQFFLSRLRAAPGWSAGNVLDVRAGKAFRAGHLAGAASLPLEESGDGWGRPEFLESELPSIFLPPRHEPLLVIGTRQEEIDRLAAHLVGRDRATVTGLALPPEVVRELPDDLKEVGSAAHFLWKPPLWLVRHADMLPPPSAGPVLDLACGRGGMARRAGLPGHGDRLATGSPGPGQKTCDQPHGNLQVSGGGPARSGSGPGRALGGHSQLPFSSARTPGQDSGPFTDRRGGDGADLPVCPRLYGTSQQPAPARSQ